MHMYSTVSSIPGQLLELTTVSNSWDQQQACFWVQKVLWGVFTLFGENDEVLSLCEILLEFNDCRKVNAMPDL